MRSASRYLALFGAGRRRAVEHGGARPGRELATCMDTRRRRLYPFPRFPTLPPLEASPHRQARRHDERHSPRDHRRLGFSEALSPGVRNFYASRILRSRGRDMVFPIAATGFAGHVLSEGHPLRQSCPAIETVAVGCCSWVANGSMSQSVRTRVECGKARDDAARGGFPIDRCGYRSTHPRVLTPGSPSSALARRAVDRPGAAAHRRPRSPPP